MCTQRLALLMRRYHGNERSIWCRPSLLNAKFTEMKKSRVILISERLPNRKAWKTNFCRTLTVLVKRRKWWKSQLNHVVFFIKCKWSKWVVAWCGTERLNPKQNYSVIRYELPKCPWCHTFIIKTKKCLHTLCLIIRMHTLMHTLTVIRIINEALVLCSTKLRLNTRNAQWENDTAR